METSSKSKWQIRLAVLLIFVIGFIAGALTMSIYRDRVRAGWSPRGGRGSFGFERVIGRLNLTPEQEAQVKDIFNDARSKLIELRKESGPKFGDVRRETDERLRAVLSPEQWEQFQQIVSENKGRRGRGRRGGDGHKQE
jgi:Spy/CpxP family protein refolding chaperone